MSRTLCALSLLFVVSCGGDENVDSDARDRCKSQCAQLNAGGRSNCIAATEMAACNDACLNQAPNVVENFNSCVDTNFWSGGIFTDDGSDQTCPERECLDIMNVEYAGEQT